MSSTLRHDTKPRWQKILSAVGLIWLVAVTCFAWGAAMIRFEVFPYAIIQPAFREITDFWVGDAADDRSPMQRLKSSIVIDPFAFAVNPSAFPLDLRFQPVDASSYKGPSVRYLENSKYYSDGNLHEYMLIYGSFAFENSNWGTILINGNGQVLRTWSMKPKNYEFNGAHIGLALSDTGDLVTNTNGVLTSYSWCGEKNWEAEWSEHTERHHHDSVLGYDYHHDITHHDGRYYTFLGPEIISVDGETGIILERIHVVDLINWARKQDLAIFDARFKKFYSAGELDESTLADLTFWDPFHFNKVDILTRELAGRFKSFEEGDMLISMRELNLVFVLRPETKKIVWYRYGLTTRQHDATFQRGYVAVFDNNPFALTGNSPRILILEESNYTQSVLFDLTWWGARMPLKGNFEFDDDSHLLAFSDDDNGRVVVGKLSGEPIFIYENSVEPGKNLQLRNMMRVSQEQVTEWSSKCNWSQ